MHQSQSPLRATLAPVQLNDHATLASLDRDPGPVADLDDPAYLAAVAADNPSPASDRAYLAWAASVAPSPDQE